MTETHAANDVPQPKPPRGMGPSSLAPLPSQRGPFTGQIDHPTKEGGRFRWGGVLPPQHAPPPPTLRAVHLLHHRDPARVSWHVSEVQRAEKVVLEAGNRGASRGDREAPSLHRRGPRQVVAACRA